MSSTVREAGSVQYPTQHTPSEVSELSVPVPWGEIRGRVWGPDHGRPVLCLHGWADNCGSFNTLIPLLPKDCRYVAMDFPGHGLSTHRPPGTFYTFPAYVADVRRLVDGLQWNKFSIVGHSMGGNVAAMFSALYPEMVDAVVLLDAFGFIPIDSKEASKVLRQGMDEMLQFERKTEHKPRVYTYEKAVERLLAANPTLSPQSVSILFERGLVQVEGGFVFSRDIRVNFKNISRHTLEQCLEMQSRIQAPVLVLLSDKGFGSEGLKSKHKLNMLVLQGWRDRNVGSTYGWRTSETVAPVDQDLLKPKNDFKHKTVVTVPGDHHVLLNNPEVVAPLVSVFLQDNNVSTQQLVAGPESGAPRHAL